jgi:hypothetical protein
MICRSSKPFSQKHADNFVPLPYQPENNDIPVQTPPTGFGALRTIAVSRIYLDNFDHITAYWVGLVPQSGMAQMALSYGTDDLHGRFSSSATAGVPQGRRDLAAIADRSGHDESHPPAMAGRPHAGAAGYVLRTHQTSGKLAGC